MRNLKATCPVNPDHKTFVTTAHVMEEWKVDEHGEFIEVTMTLQVDVGPDPDNIWCCSECGAQAMVLC